MVLRLLPFRSLPAPATHAIAPRDAERLRGYREALAFYRGQHWERQPHGRSALVVNYARAIVDKGVSYLLGRGVGFAVPPARENDAAARERAAWAERILYAVYQDEGLDAVDLQAATNAALLGDAVFKVFWDAAAGRVRVVSVDPGCFFATWASDDLAALRQVELVYELAAEEARARWGVAGGRGAGMAVVRERWTAARFTLEVDGRAVRDGPNPYGFIPFVHIPNLPLPNTPWGRSDLVDVIPLNRALNERLSDEADAIRYHADPPVIFKGVREHGDLAVGPGTVWDVPADADVHLLEWRGPAPAVGAHIERLLRALYEVAETPRAAFGDNGRLLSGVALETELRPLLQRTLRKRVFWGAGLRARNALVLRLAEQFGWEAGLGGERPWPGVFAPYRTRIVWPPMVPRDDALEVRNNVALVAAGLRSHRTAMDALGEERPEEELQRVLDDRRALRGNVEC